MSRNLPIRIEPISLAKIIAPHVGNPRLLTSSQSARAASAADLAPPPPRPGSNTSHSVPSRHGDTLRYRDGRVTDLQGNPL